MSESWANDFFDEINAAKRRSSRHAELPALLSFESILRVRASVIEAANRLEALGEHETTLMLELCLSESWLRGLLEEFYDADL